jgi:hypothetical protein
VGKSKRKDITMICFLLNSSLPTDTLKYLQNLNENIDAVRRIVDVSNSTIANEISAVNIMLVAFTIVFGIVGVFLGFYISWLQRKISKMSDNIEEKEQTIKALAKAVEETENKIQSDISGLYAKLREEETIALLKRLEEEPLDISNLSKLLLARPIGKEGYPILKSAYLNLLNNNKEQGAGESDFSEYESSYLLLFFQHYMYQSLMDDDIREDLRKDFYTGCQCAFKRDIIRSTKDLCQVLSKSSMHFEKKSILVDYLKAINQSEFRNLQELKEIFQNEINDKSLLVDAIDQCTSDKVYLEMFGVEAPKNSDEGNNDDKEKEVTK